MIITIEGLFDGIQRLSNGRVTAAYLEISSMVHRYNRLNCISFIASTITIDTPITTITKKSSSIVISR